MRQVIALSLEQQSALAQKLGVLFRADAAGAHAAAFVQVQHQAGALLADVARKLARAGGQGKGLAHNINGRLGRTAAAVGTEITRPVVLPRRNDGKSRIFPFAQTYVGVAFVVFEQDIVFRLIALNKRVFQQQGVKLGLGVNGLKIVNVFDQPPRLGRVRGQIGKILADAVFQHLGLADVNDLTVLVAHQVHAGHKRQLVRLLPKL